MIHAFSISLNLRIISEESPTKIREVRDVLNAFYLSSWEIIKEEQDIYNLKFSLHHSDPSSLFLVRGFVYGLRAHLSEVVEVRRIRIEEVEKHE